MLLAEPHTQPLSLDGCTAKGRPSPSITWVPHLLMSHFYSAAESGNGNGVSFMPWLSSCLAGEVFSRLHLLVAIPPAPIPTAGVRAPRGMDCSGCLEAVNCLPIHTGPQRWSRTGCTGIWPSQKVTPKTPNPLLKPHILSPFLLQFTAGHHKEQGNAGKFSVTS